MSDTNSVLDAVRALHQRVQEPDPFAYVEQYLVSCSCHHGNQVWLWRPGDPEPDWKCPTLRALDGES